MSSRFPLPVRSALLAILSLAALTLPGCSGPAVSAFAASSMDFEKPGRLATIDGGRQINLRCTGRGAPTVILESGWGAWSSAWGRVQPTVAKTTRVCSYDRPGYGFSTPGSLPRDGAAIARDLDQALRAAQIEGPFVVVGHSAGGLYARLFAARRLDDTKGLVLVDSTIERRAPLQPGQGDGFAGPRRRTQGCLAMVEAGAPDPASPEWARCTATSNSSQARLLMGTADYWRSQLSELDEIMGRTSDQVNRIGTLLGGTPAYVLTASDTAASSPKVNLSNPVSIWVLLQQDLANRFQPGFQRTVYSSHLMFKDRPEVVSDAILEMVRAARAGTPPPPLPASELPDTPSDAATTWSGGKAP